MKNLKDTLAFGKYKGQAIRSIIEKDPQYIEWALRSVPNFNLTPTAENYLYEVLESRDQPDYAHDYWWKD